MIAIQCNIMVSRGELLLTRGSRHLPANNDSGSYFLLVNNDSGSAYFGGVIIDGNTGTQAVHKWYLTISYDATGTQPVHK